MAELAAYTADEASGVVVDVTGNGHDFTLVGNTQRTAAGAGYTHGGSTPNSKGLTQSSTGTDPGPALFGQTTQRTLAMWLKMSADFTGWVWEWQLTTVPTGIWGLLCLSGSIGFRGRNTGGTTAFASMTRPTDNAWHHYAGTFDGTSVRLYFDGVLQGSPVALSGGIGTNANALNVFDVTLGTPPTIDDPRIHDTALSAATILALSAVPPGAAGSNVTGTTTVAITALATITGQRSVAGAASTATALNATVTGERTVSGTASTSVTATATATAQRSITGTSAAALTFTTTALGAVSSGASDVTGTASAALGFTAAATGVRTVIGTATTSPAFVASASGKRTIAGQVAASYALTANLLGLRAIHGTAQAGFVFTAAGNAGTIVPFTPPLHTTAVVRQIIATAVVRSPAATAQVRSPDETG